MAKKNPNFKKVEAKSAKDKGYEVKAKASPKKMPSGSGKKC